MGLAMSRTKPIKKRAFGEKKLKKNKTLSYNISALGGLLFAHSAFFITTLYLFYLLLTLSIHFSLPAFFPPLISGGHVTVMIDPPI